MNLFSKTWINDLPWIDLALKSVSFFCKEPVDWSIVIEKQHFPELQDIAGRLRFWNHNHQIRIKLFTVEDHWPEALSMNGYMGQQWIKMNAHKVMGNEIFWNWDSDVIAQRPFSQKDFTGSTGRPIHWFSHFNSLMGGADDAAHNQRRAVMKQIFRFEDISFEFMRCMPIPMNGTILEHGSRNRIWDESKDKLIRADRSFSEFNIIGQFSHFFFPDAYEWRNAEASGPTWSGGYKEGGHGSGTMDGISIVTQCYSWGGLPEHISKYVNNLPVDRPA
jgi:hypothetical protein